MRLAFVTVGDTSRRTGGHLYNARVLDGLRERGVEVEEIVACGESPEDQSSVAPSLDERLSLERFDVIAVDALARITCAPHLDHWRERAPLLAMVHELPSVARADESERPNEEPLLRAERLVCVSRHGAGILQSRGVAPERIHVVPPGLDSSPARGYPARFPRAEGGAARVLCVAQWIPRKGIVELVEAWKKRRKAANAELEFIGETAADPVYTARVREAIAGADDILVRGPVPEDELRRAYAAADLFTLPSAYEGYGMVYAEAMSYGLPVVACSAGPVPEVVGEAGILVQPGDVEELSRALERALSDEAFRRAMSEAAFRRAGELSGWGSTVDGFKRALEAAVAQRAASL